MNDRFKFRVWDTEEKCFYYPTEKDYCYKGNKVIECTSLEMQEQLGIIGLLHFLTFNSKRFIIEQCTGLKDKNHNLIYEGDAVRTHNGHLAFIKHSEDQPSFVINLTKDFSLLSNGMFNICTVIGNIHENPELRGE
jgi:uncharacterized phage protein (TIGR01671 family)